MSNGTKRQKNKKNKNRPKAGDMGFVSSMQRNYKKLSPSNQQQASLF